MSTELWSNNAASTLSSTITAIATSITLDDASDFPSPGAGEFCFATLDDGAGNVEIVQVTSRSGNTLTVVRAQQGTTGFAFSAGDACEVRLTRDGLIELQAPHLRYVSVTSSRNILASDHGKVLLIDTSGGAVTLTLPTGLADGFFCSMRLVDATATASVAAGGGATYASEFSYANLTTLQHVAVVEHYTGNAWFGTGFEA